MTKVTAEHFRALGAQAFAAGEACPTPGTTWQSRARHEGWVYASVDFLSPEAKAESERTHPAEFALEREAIARSGCACEPAGVDGVKCPDENNRLACEREAIDPIVVDNISGGDPKMGALVQEALKGCHVVVVGTNDVQLVDGELVRKRTRHVSHHVEPLPVSEQEYRVDMLEPFGYWMEPWAAIGCINGANTSEAIYSHIDALLVKATCLQQREVVNPHAKALIARYRNKAKALIEKWGGL